MKSPSKALLVVSAIWLAVIGCDRAAKRAAIEKANAQVGRIVADLDAKTTKAGVYVRAKEDEVNETDPWGTKVKVSYSQGGIAEVVSVRSAGPDKEFQTSDDVVAQGMSANFKGIGEGIKDNIKETASNAAKGVVKGTVEGVKETIKEALPFKKKKPEENEDVKPTDAENSSEPEEK
ncbi:MAG: hypothetical protein FJ267_16725 [Planctomycetes bacterium]|nr:hypothetical protein [Planctomycetota bacterium]